MKKQMKHINVFYIITVLLSLSGCKGGLTGPSLREEMIMTDTEAEEFDKAYIVNFFYAYKPTL